MVLNFLICWFAGITSAFIALINAGEQNSAIPFVMAAIVMVFSNIIIGAIFSLPVMGGVNLVFILLKISLSWLKGKKFFSGS